MSRYSTPRLPMVHNGSKRTLIRVSVAKANKHNSMTSDFENILVLPEHVHMAYDFLCEMYNQAELSEMKRKEFERINVTQEDIDVVKGSERMPKILAECSFGFCASPKLATMLDVSKGTIKNDATELQAMGLLFSKTGMGYSTTSKGKRLLKRLKKGESNKIALTNYQKGTPLNKKSILISQNQNDENDSTIVQNDYTNTNTSTSSSSSKVVKEDNIEEIQYNKNEEKVNVLSSENIVLSEDDDNNGKIKKVANGFIQMFAHPNFKDKSELTVDDMISYFGTSKDQIEFQCRQLSESDPLQRFIFLDNKFRYNER
jgi:hypothetical protein